MTNPHPEGLLPCKKRIPIAAARRVAEEYGYDQIIIIGRKVGDAGGEHVTTYGVNRANCDAAAKIGDHLKHNVMGWPRPSPPPVEPEPGGWA